MLSHQRSSILLLLTGSSCKGCLRWNNCLAVFLLSSPHSSMRVHVSRTMASHRKHGRTSYGVSLNTTNPCARWPLLTACPTKPSDASFVRLASTEQDKPLSLHLPFFEDAHMRCDHSSLNSVRDLWLSRTCSKSPPSSSVKARRSRLATDAPSLASSSRTV